jgi:hypothetical protein
MTARSRFVERYRSRRGHDPQTDVLDDDGDHLPGVAGSDFDILIGGHDRAFVDAALRIDAVISGSGPLVRRFELRSLRGRPAGVKMGSFAWQQLGQRSLRCSPRLDPALRRAGALDDHVIDPAVRAAIQDALRPESDHADGLPDPLPTGRVLRLRNTTVRSSEVTLVLAGRDERGSYLDIYRRDNDDTTSWHGRVRKDGCREALESLEGQIGIRASDDTG